MKGTRTGIFRPAAAAIVVWAALWLPTDCSSQSHAPAAPAAAESVGILSGYQLYSVPLRGPARRSNLVDLRVPLKAPIARQSPDQDYPDVKLLSASTDGELLLINLCCLAGREDGPLVAVESKTGKPLGTFAISDADAVAAFVPGASGPFVAHWTDYITATGGAATAVFDARSGARTLTLPGREPPGGRFLFLNPTTLLARDASSRQYRLLDTASWKDIGALSPPVTQEFSVIDARQGKVLIERLDRLRSISILSSGDRAVPVVIDKEETAVDRPSSYLLAGSGDRVVKWKSSGEVTIYDAAGRLVSRKTIGSTILACAVHPSGGSVAFAVDNDIVIVDVTVGTAVTRLPKILPHSSAEVFLFWQTGRPVN